jgi:hypothetical protein
MSLNDSYAIFDDDECSLVLEPIKAKILIILQELP